MADELLQKLTEATLQNGELLRQMSVATGLKVIGGVQTATPLHGVGGIFSSPALERDIITAHVRPTGIAANLRLLPNVTEDPRYGTLTGYTATTGAQPTHACEDAPQGYVKGCNLTARFGLARFDTQEIEMDKVMLKLNRGDHTDLILHGEVLGLTGLYPSGLNQQQILNIITMSEMVGTGVQMERHLNVQMWQGTVAAGSFPGLDSQIATGQIDADTQVACPALDSDVKSFAYNDVCGNGLDIVEYLSMMAMYLDWNATSMGLDPVQWVLVMRPPLWYELTSCWPCRYMSNRCSNLAGTALSVINDSSATDMRDDLRRRRVLPINGVEYPVVLDTGIFEHNNANNGNLAAGQFASSIYFVPLTIGGGFPVTYREYVDYRLAQPDTDLMRVLEEWFWTDNGAFSWSVEQDKWCYKLSLKTEQRVILRTPHLAGKLQHVRYSPLQHLREPDPSSPYWQDGGVSLRSHTFGYAVWGNSR